MDSGSLVPFLTAINTVQEMYQRKLYSSKIFVHTHNSTKYLIKRIFSQQQINTFISLKDIKLHPLL